jgi:hypothetical protein
MDRWSDGWWPVARRSVPRWLGVAVFIVNISATASIIRIVATIVAMVIDDMRGVVARTATTAA